MPLISIIIPVYNAEKYLVRAVKSVEAQTLTDWELLLVDDGSTDGSGALCDELAAADRRVIALHKQNGGVSSARNFGVTRAAGEFITFMDNDDYALPRWLENMASAQSETGADVVKTAFYRVPDTDPSLPAPSSEAELPEGSFVWGMKSETLTGALLLRRMVEDLPHVLVWNQLCRAELLRRCPFPDGHNSEDITVSAELSQLAREIVCVDKGYYCWVMRAGSQSAVVAPRVLLDDVHSYGKICRLLLAVGDEEGARLAAAKTAKCLFYGPLRADCAARDEYKGRVEQPAGELYELEKRLHFCAILPPMLRWQMRVYTLSPWLYKLIIRAMYRLKR